MLFKSPKILTRYYPNRVWGISVSSPSVALTFDDGPDASITPWILDFLKENAIKATFFCVGSNVQRNPSLYAQILAEGHVIGNHSMNHENGFKTKDSDYLKSVAQTSELMNTTLFRPPYGRLRKSAEKELLKEFDVVMWSWLSYDYNPRISTKRILNHSKRIKSGDILVFHDNQKTKERLKEILPPIILNLKKRGFSFVLLQTSIQEIKK